MIEGDSLPLLDALLAGKGAVVALWFLAIFLGERLRPAARPPAPATLAAARARPFLGAPARLGRNLSFWLINVGLSLLIVLPLTAWAAESASAWRPDWWQGWPGLLFDLLLLDFLIYWWHLANHRLPLLWRFHQVHHLDRFLDSTTALRFHFGEVLLSALARAAVILLLGFPFASVLTFEALLLMATIFHHSNLRLPPAFERALGRVVITPAIHWVHHHKLRRDTDSNYGTIFSFWDRLFGSVSRQRREPDMPIGVEGAEEARLWPLLLRPFRPSSAAARDR